MKQRDFLTDEQVELEIERLRESEAVRLAKREQQIKYKRRQYMYTLKNMEKRGKDLINQGYNLSNIESRLMGDGLDD